MSQLDGVVMRMMAAYGGAATLIIPFEGQYVDGEYIPAAKLEKPVKVLLDEYPQMSAGDKSNFNTLIMEGDRRCLMQPLNKANPNEAAYEPKSNKDTLRIGDTEWKIMNMKQVNPSGSNAVIYELHLRK